MKNHAIDGRFLAVTQFFFTSLIVIKSIFIFSFALASESNFFNCLQTIPDKTGCLVGDNDLMSLTHVEAFEQDFSVKYEFQCVGHREPLMIETDSEMVELVRNSGASNLNIRGSTFMRVRALNERNFYRSSFASTCDLVVHSVSGIPSSNTLVLWNAQAESLAKILKMSWEFYALSLSMDAYQNYNSSKFSILKSKLEILLESDPDNIDFKVLLATVNAGLAGTAIPYSTEEIRRAGGSLTVWAKNELIKNKEEAIQLVAKFEKYRQIVNALLKKSIAEVGDL